MIKRIWKKLFPGTSSAITSAADTADQAPIPEVPPAFHFAAFDSDRATTIDLLGRKKFAIDLCRVITSRIGGDSIVIAIYGPWGSGKSTIKDLMLAHFFSLGDGAPQILEFNPWYWNGQEQLLSAFFDELDKAYSKYKEIPKADIRKNKQRLQNYKNTLAMGSNIARVLQLSSLQSGHPELAVAAGVAAMAAQATSSVLESGHELMHDEETSISSQKAALATAFRSLPRPMIVVMDDIDRLDFQEIKEVLKLVKANADFPNLVYLLLMDREYVERGLSENEAETRGRQYLEKIVQVGFEVPLLGDRELKIIIENKLKKYKEQSTVKLSINNGRLDEIISDSGALQYFKHIRDVKRFFSMFSFQVSTLIINNEFEADFADLFGIELLRVHEPQVYSQISMNRLLFSGADPLDLVAHAKLQNEDFLPQLLKPILEKAANAPAVVKILNTLFPNIRHALPRGTRHHSDHYALLAEKRICTNEFFERYFKYQLGKYEFSESEFQSFLLNINDTALILNALIEADKAGKLNSLLDKISASSDPRLLVNAVFLLRAMAEYYDHFPENTIGSMILWHAGWRLLSKLVKTNRDETIRELYFTSQPPNQLLMHWLSVDIAEGKRRSNIINEALQEELKKYLAEKIKVAMNSEEYENVSINKLGILFQFWEDWGNEEDIKSWMLKTAEHAHGFVRLLNLYKSSGPDFDRRGQQYEYIKFHDLVKYLPIEMIAHFIDLHGDAITDEKDRLIYLIAVESYNKYCANKQIDPKQPKKD